MGTRKLRLWYCVRCDDSTVADTLRRDVRVLCWVLTNPGNHVSRAIHIEATWGRRCNVLLFVTEKDDLAALSVIRVDGASGYQHLTAKTMTAFDHVYKHYRNEADWFLKVIRHILMPEWFPPFRCRSAVAVSPFRSAVPLCHCDVPLYRCRSSVSAP